MPRRQGRDADRETRWIDWIRSIEEDPAGFPVGIGDDAAVWRPPAGEDVVLTIDSQARGTHFREGWLHPRELGRRAVTVSASDLAAMTALPAGFLVAILAEEGYAERDFRELHRGLREAAAEYGAPIVGGNISRGPLSVTVAAFGRVERDRLPLRGGIEAGDELWVTGSPGLARLGLLLLLGEIESPSRSSAARRAREAFLRPRARIEEARFLRDHWPLTALIDLSDGLSTDCRHLLEERRRREGEVGIELDEERIEGLEPLRSVARALGASATDAALAGGEDYELCFTARPGSRRPSPEAFARRFGMPLTPVGRCIAERGLWLRDGKGGRRRIEAGGFRHVG